MANADSLKQMPASTPARAALRRRGARLSALAVLLVVGIVAAFPGCDEASCPKLDDLDACTIDECQNGTAVHTYLGDGHPCFMGRLEGACSSSFCIVSCATEADCDDGRPCTKPMCENGACILVGPDGDKPGSGIPSDGNVCTHDGCLHDEPYYWPMPEATACNDGKGECDNGICSSCEIKADCGANLECREWECDQGKCIPDDAAKGVLLIDDIQGDCLQRVCDGHGGVDKVVNLNDSPVSTNPCLTWTCVGWTPVVDVQSQKGQPCLTSTGIVGVCDGMGACAGCLDDGDCPDPLFDRCYNHVCVSCGDNTQNGGETGVDCGGSCGACLGAACTADAECASDECVFTNAMPVKVCCDAPCDGECEQCDPLTGSCVPVPWGKEDVETCNSAGEACNGSKACKAKTGYACLSSTDCLSNSCNLTPTPHICN